ncbi:hypothetical protein BC831DRAFT_467086 [Entophlyctis helioformis]|nr:hypothetical protein BC831DRAFT_467086 [Entophlyctis helioformis]
MNATHATHATFALNTRSRRAAGSSAAATTGRPIQASTDSQHSRAVQTPGGVQPRPDRPRIINRRELLDSGGSTSFGRTYFSLCELHSLPVMTEVMTPALESKNHLYVDVDRVRRDEDWSPLLKALRQNRDLTQIYVFSNGNATAERRESEAAVAAAALAVRVAGAGSLVAARPTKAPLAAANRFASMKPTGLAPGPSTIHRVLPHLMSALRECLAGNPFIVKLELAGFDIHETALALLAKGLYKNETIQELSLARTDLGDSGLFQLAPAIRTIMHLRMLNLGACNLTERGAHIIAALLKSLAVRRQADQWAWSLRLSELDLERLEANHLPAEAAPRPLKRLNLCRNQIGDAGCEALLDLVREEVGLLALDIQMNNLTNRSGLLAKTVLQQNVEMVILDMRNNCIDEDLLYSVHELLAKNDARRTRAAAVFAGIADSRQILGYEHTQEQPLERDADLLWLNTERPLKDTYHPIGPNIRQYLHTESSVRKRKSATAKTSGKPGILVQPSSFMAKTAASLSRSSGKAASNASVVGSQTQRMAATPKPTHRVDTTQLVRFLLPSSPSARETLASIAEENLSLLESLSPPGQPTQPSPARVAFESHRASQKRAEQAIRSSKPALRPARAPRPASATPTPPTAPKLPVKAWDSPEIQSTSRVHASSVSPAKQHSQPRSQPHSQGRLSAQSGAATRDTGMEMDSSQPRGLTPAEISQIADAVWLPSDTSRASIVGNHGPSRPLAFVDQHASHQFLESFQSQPQQQPIQPQPQQQSTQPQAQQQQTQQQLIQTVQMSNAEQDDLRRSVHELEQMVRDALHAATSGSVIQPLQPQPQPQPQPSPEAQHQQQVSTPPMGMQPHALLIPGSGQRLSSTRSTESLAGVSPDIHTQQPRNPQQQDSDAQGQQQTQVLDTLIQLMESSLSSFHAMLDQMETHEDRRQRRRRDRKSRHAVAASQEVPQTST